MWTNSCGTEDRAVDVRLGGEVDDRGTAFSGLRDRFRVGDVASDELVIDSVEVRRVPRVRELVEDDHVDATLGEPAHEV